MPSKIGSGTAGSLPKAAFIYYVTQIGGGEGLNAMLQMHQIFLIFNVTRAGGGGGVKDFFT